MKTIKIKVKLTPNQIESCDKYLEELSWVWNLILANQLHNHCIYWYEWATELSIKLAKTNEKLEKLKPEQQQLIKSYYNSTTKPKLSKKDQELVNKYNILSRWSPFSLEGIIPVPLRIGNSAYEGLSCQIATGGSYWKQNQNTVIPVNTKKGISFIKGSKLVKGDKPWQQVEIKPHEYKRFPSGKYEGRELITLGKFDNLNGLNALRASQNLPDLTVSSNYIGGLLGFFKESWKAFLDSKRIISRKPKFKRDTDKITTLSNNQCPPNRIDVDKNIIAITGFGAVTVNDKSWVKRLNLSQSLPRTYMLTKRPSGYYINIVVAHPLQEEKSALANKLPKIKKQFGENSQEYADIKSKLKFIEQQIKESSIIKGKGLSAIINPGVPSVVSTDHGALFLPNLTRERISIHIEKLQSRLNKAKNINDAKWKASGNKGARPKTKNEIKLQSKISRLHERGANSANCFNHKLSTRISRTYDHIYWEDTQLNNLLKQAEPQSLPENVGYGASVKHGLNWITKQRCLGDLKSKTKQKIQAKSGSFEDTKGNHTTQTCHCCNKKSVFNQVQQTDINAAKNHDQNKNLDGHLR